ncbi:MAG: tetratricopeptide repeat protein [Bacteroidales bacterium]|nr:tetratricopeptide repeat protein [Bacteroidales bacterium]
MTKKNKKQTAEESFENVENALSTTERFIEDNQKSLSIIVIAIVATIGLYMGYHKYVAAPLEKEAQNQAFMAESFFEKDSFNLALNGKDDYPGFLQIIEEFGSSKTGNLAQYYAGICYLRMGEYQNAIDYLSKFDSDDKMVAPIAVGAMGDAYSQLNKLEEAVNYYVKAANYSDNEFTAPIYLKKAGLVYLELNENKKALEVFNTIKENYPSSTEGRQIEKYITKASILAEKK